MVKSPVSGLDCTFAALVDPTRRAILARLELGGQRGDQRTGAPVRDQAADRHEAPRCVWARLGLITRTKTGRTVAVELAAGPMEEAMHWLRRYERFWSSSARPACGPCRGHGSESTSSRGGEGRSMTSLTLVRRIAARPSIIFDALTTPDGIRLWWGPDDKSRADRRNRCPPGGPLPGALSYDRRTRSMRAAASISRWCGRHAW